LSDAGHPPVAASADEASPSATHPPGLSVLSDAESRDGRQRPNLSTGIRLEPATAINNRRELMLLSIRDTGSRTPLAQEIFDEISIAIVEGRLLPGQTLSSVNLARRFGTSRTPVREAIAELERQGVIVVLPRRRPSVAHASLKQIKDIYDLRATLFSLVSELIVDTCPPERLTELWEWQAALEDDVARGAVDDYFWHSVGFRLVEVRLTDNDELQRIVSSLGMRTLQLRHQSASQPGRIQRSVDDHRRLLLAYDERDKLMATTMTRTLIMSGYRNLVRSGLIAEDLPAPTPSCTEADSDVDTDSDIEPGSDIEPDEE
jgi:DNA-binding GntR family transcriptional regulator